MRLVIISGRSGSGKTSALHLLEDEGFTCIDNLPADLLPALIAHIQSANKQSEQKIAVGIDARNFHSDLSKVPDIIRSLAHPGSSGEVVYLDTSREILLKRFSETRRKHPLSDDNIGLNEAIAKEKQILAPIANAASFTIDTTRMSIHELRGTIKRLVVGESSSGTAIMFTSFGFKYGVPVDADFVFDVRCLPNPYWSPELRSKSGLEEEVINFLDRQKEVQEMEEDLYHFIHKWAPQFEQSNRSYLTIAIGCTGGMHRSVYLCERLSQHMKQHYGNVQVRHRQLEQIPGQ